MVFEVVIHPMTRRRTGEPMNEDRRPELGVTVWSGADRAEAEEIARAMVLERLVIATIRTAAGQELLVLSLESPQHVSTRPLRDPTKLMTAAEPQEPRAALPAAPAWSSSDPLEINKACRRALAASRPLPAGVLKTGEKLQITFARTVKGQLFARAVATGRWIPIERAEA